MRKALLILGAVAFIGFALLNLNDPDSVIWVLAYGLTALMFIGALVGRADRRIVGIYALTLAVWMLTMLPGMIEWARLGFPTITGSMQAHEPHIEVVREFLGLLIAVLALAALWRATPQR